MTVAFSGGRRLDEGTAGEEATYQCGQSSIASGVMRGSIEEAVMFGVVRRARTAEESLGLLVVNGEEVGADVGVCWCFCCGCCDRLVRCEEVSGGCGEIFVAPREGEPGWEAASELKRSSSSLAKADLRVPGVREGVMVAVEAIVEDECGCDVGVWVSFGGGCEDVK
jgi:hypothetical protein